MKEKSLFKIGAKIFLCVPATCPNTDRVTVLLRSTVAHLSASAKARRERTATLPNWIPKVSDRVQKAPNLIQDNL